MRHGRTRGDDRFLHSFALGFAFLTSFLSPSIVFLSPSSDGLKSRVRSISNKLTGKEERDQTVASEA